MPGKLYIVSTPVGNLEDITYRAVRVLGESDLIACEDTRHAKKLLSRYGIDTPLTSYHEHNEDYKSRKLLSRLLDGEDVAVISDAGTPLISDPGYRVTNLAISNEIQIVSIPGPSSVLAALTMSGLPTDSFCFLGFLPKTEKKIRDYISELDEYTHTLVFYESPNRLKKTLTYLFEILGDRKGVICREITKLHEETIRGTISEMIGVIENRNSIKGEITVVIDGYREVKKDRSSRELSAVRNQLKSLKNLDLSLKDAVKVVNKESGMSKKEIYTIALEIWGN